MVEINIDTKQLLPHLKHILLGITNGVARVLPPAINRTLTMGNTALKREIRKEYAIKMKDIPTALHRANKSNFTGALIVRQGMLDMNKFPFRPTRPGSRRILNVEVKRGRRKDIPHGFVAQMPSSGYLGPFIRKGASRLPIKKLKTISAAIMASQPTVLPEVEKVMGDTLDRRLDHEINRVLNSVH